VGPVGKFRCIVALEDPDLHEASAVAYFIIPDGHAELWVGASPSSGPDEDVVRSREFVVYPANLPCDLVKRGILAIN